MLFNVFILIKPFCRNLIGRKVILLCGAQDVGFTKIMQVKCQLPIGQSLTFFQEVFNGVVALKVIWLCFYFDTASGKPFNILVAFVKLQRK